MNEIFNLILMVIGSIAGVGILAGGAGYLISSFKKSGKQEKTDVINMSQDVINFWKDQAVNYQLILERKEKDWNDKFQEMTNQIGQIQGQFNAEKAQNDRLEKIFQNRDPEHQEFMKLVMRHIENQDVVNREIVKILGDIHTYTSEQIKSVTINN